jgi:hypothetical protein
MENPEKLVKIQKKIVNFYILQNYNMMILLSLLHRRMKILKTIAKISTLILTNLIINSKYLTYLFCTYNHTTILHSTT